MRLAELEKEFNEVGRETARAFLPKSRVPSGETDTTAGASVYTSEGGLSPTKVSVPSRKQRNQQPSRINDIALATEISTSLLAQLKDLQAVLLEREEALKATTLDRSQLEIEVEGLSQRLRTLDESESRLKDVNWNLETQVRERGRSLRPRVWGNRAPSLSMPTGWKVPVFGCAVKSSNKSAISIRSSRQPISRKSISAAEREEPAGES